MNLRKSEIVLVGVVQGVEELAVDFGCKVSLLPMNYLGLPLGSLPLRLKWHGTTL